jgi:hypothetical protein
MGASFAALITRRVGLTAERLVARVGNVHLLPLDIVDLTPQSAAGLLDRLSERDEIAAGKRRADDSAGSLPLATRRP